MMTLVPTDGTVLDLFCGGAGGWSLGMHRAGYRTVAACEIDDWRRSVFATTQLPCTEASASATSAMNNPSAPQREPNDD